MPASTPSVVMTKKGGKKYRCYLPEEGTAGEAASEADALEAAPSVASYLMPIKGTCFYRLEGWWTYEFCFLQRRGSQVVRRRSQGHARDRERTVAGAGRAADAAV